MVTLDKYEFGSKEYEQEIKRENAYFFNEILCAIESSMYLPDKIQKLVIKLIEEIEKEIGEEEITVSAKHGKE